jgi:competence protein ComEC
MRLPIIAFATGIVFLQCQAELPPWWLFCLSAAGLSGAAMWWRGAGKRVACLLVAFLAGVAWAAWRAESRLEDALPERLEGRDVRIQGQIAGLPQDFSHGLRFEFLVDKASTGGESIPERLMLSWYRGRGEGQMKELPNLQPGQHWRLTVRLKRPHGNANPGSFDYEAWLLERNVRATGHVRSGAVYLHDDGYGQPFMWIERWRARIRASFTAAMPESEYPWSGIMVALAIGDQKAIPQSTWTIFNRTGTNHLFSISGLHVTMVAALCARLLASFWRRIPYLALRFSAQHAGLLAACLAALLYALLAGFAVPAQRTLYMLLVAAGAMLSRRIVAPSRILCLALLTVVVIDPWSVLAAGFWLSFGVVAALLYVGSGEIGSKPSWRQRLANWGGVQWAVTLASLPVLLLLFQQFSLVSPVANALAIPVISFLVTPLVLFAAILPWWPIMALAHGLLDAVMLFLAWCATWPVWQSPMPPVWAVLSAGVAVAVCLLPRGVPGRWLGVPIMLPLFFWPAAHPAPGTAWIDVLDVGQGLASVVRTASHVLIYDPGPMYSAESDAGQRVVVPFLRSQGVKQVDMMVVTHRDSDHAGGAASVLSALPVAELRSSVEGMAGSRCAAGQRWHWDGVEFEMLYPDIAAYSVDRKSNHLSCVLRITAGHQRMLLTGDIEAPDEAALLAQDPRNLVADVLLVPHHGSRTSSTAPFLVAVGAREAIVPVGYRNRFGHPRADVLARHAAVGSRIWRTDQDGAVRVVLGEGAVGVTAWRREHRRYWHGR